MQKPSRTVLLHNKFQCLQDLSDSRDNGVYDEIHTTETVSIHSDISVLSNADCVNFRETKQRLHECKPPSPCSKNLSQPLLVDESQIYWMGIKTKLGFLMGYRIIFTEQGVNMSKQYTMVDMVNTCSPAD